MADSLCGPSNGAKSLLNHVNRDRSLQQDRTVSGISGTSTSSFRSQSANVNAADQAFTGFQQNAHLEPASGVSPFGHDRLGPGTGIAGFGIQQHWPGGPQGVHAPIPTLSSPGPAVASHHAAPQDWVNQFSGMQLNGGPHTIAPAFANPQHRSLGELNEGAVNTRPYPCYPSPQPFAPLHQLPTHMAGAPGVYGSQNQFVPQQAESSLDVEAFNRAFGDYDEADFKEELANWAQEKTGNNIEAITSSAPLAEVTENLRAEETKAEEAEAARRSREDEELARAAMSIVNSVSDNDSEKFKESNFFRLMRRIGDRQVVVDGPYLMDATSGENLTTRDTIYQPADSAIPGVLSAAVRPSLDVD